MFKHYLCCVAFIRTVAQQRKSNLGRAALAGLLCITVACIGVGCGNDDDVVTPTETEVVEVTVGDSIYFEQGGTIYEGRVVEDVSATEVRVRLDNGSDMVVNVDRIAGTLIADHSELDSKVIMRGEREGEVNLSGTIVGVYSNGVRKIEIHTVIFEDGTHEVLDVPRIRFVHEDTEYEEGGYLTQGEFRKALRLSNYLPQPLMWRVPPECCV